MGQEGFRVLKVIVGAEIPSVLEVEELIVRSKDGGAYMKLIAGSEGSVAKIQWYSFEDEGTAAEMWGGSSGGMVFTEDNFDGTWTSFCLFEGKLALCP